MKSSLYVLTLFIGLGCVTSAERRVNGSEGESVEIECNYPDAYQYKKKYWCRHPCGNKDLLIKTGKTDTVVSVGRFSLYDNVSFRTFTVTMSRLTLQDTGVYYCGLEQRGTDRLSKIHLRVRKAPTVPTVTPSAPGSVTEEVTATALTASSSQDTASSTTVDLDRCRSVFRLSIGLPCVFILTSIVIAVEIITRLNSCRGKRSAAQSDGQREVTGDTAMKMAEAAGLEYNGPHLQPLDQGCPVQVLKGHCDHPSSFFQLLYLYKITGEVEALPTDSRHNTPRTGHQSIPGQTDTYSLQGNSPQKSINLQYVFGLWEETGAH